jgi:3-mercaptopyruvate sulfurtransferase SseA
MLARGCIAVDAIDTVVHCGSGEDAAHGAVLVTVVRIDLVRV